MIVATLAGGRGARANLAEQARQRLEGLPHERVADDDEPPVGQALVEARRIEGLQVAAVRHVLLPILLLPQLLKQAQTQIWLPP